MNTGASLVGTLAALLAFGCSTPPQRVPEPMRHGAADELPPPDPLAGATFQASVMRHADPVEVWYPGSLDGFPLTFWNKRVRLGAGTTVRTHGGGRAEFSWDDDATALVFSGPGAVRIGDPTAGEPLVAIDDVTHARMSLTPEDTIALPGGAELRGDDELPSGPFVLERVAADVVRLTNQSRRTGLLRYLDVALELGPGETLDLPLVSSGTAPLRSDAEPTPLEGGGLRLNVFGNVEAFEGERTLGVRAAGDVRCEGLGIRLDLRDGDRATLSSIRRRPVSALRGAPPAGSPTDPPLSASAPN